MRINARTQMLQGSLANRLRQAKKLGYDGIELGLEDRQFQFESDYIEDYVIDYIRELSQEIGLNIDSIGNHRDYVNNDDAFEQAQLGIKATPKYGCGIYLMATGQRTYHDDEQYHRFIERTKLLAQTAQDVGVQIAMELEVRQCAYTLEDYFKVKEAINLDSLKCNLDIGHLFLSEINPIAGIKQLNTEIIHVHVENLPARGVHFHQVPYDGVMNVSSYIEALKELNYNGPMAFDYYLDDYADRSPEVINYLRKLI